jgi:phosphoglycerate dehydrogenase-like enzyme
MARNELYIFVDLALPADALETLRAGTKGHHLVFSRNPASSVLAKGELDPQIRTADVAFGQPDTEAIVEAAQLKWVHISSSGITRYDNPKFREMTADRKIAVTNSASVYSEACAVHVFSFILAQARGLPGALKSHAPNGSDAWHALRASCRRLRGETVLILGYGEIGKRLAKLLLPLGLNVLAYRRKARGDEEVPVVTEPQLADALNKADHVVDILPDNIETRHFCNAVRFAAMKPGAIFYNIGRGITVDQEALAAALQSGRIGAAWLDVTEPEPLPDGHPLLAEPNCFITPHIAGGQPDEAKALVRHFLENLDLFVRGAPLVDRVM